MHRYPSSGTLKASGSFVTAVALPVGLKADLVMLIYLARVHLRQSRAYTRSPKRPGCSIRTSITISN